jgi:hypothetical protein
LKPLAPEGGAGRLNVNPPVVGNRIDVGRESHVSRVVSVVYAAPQ